MQFSIFTVPFGGSRTQLENFHKYLQSFTKYKSLFVPILMKRAQYIRKPYAWQKKWFDALSQLDTSDNYILTTNSFLGFSRLTYPLRSAFVNDYTLTNDMFDSRVISLRDEIKCISEYEAKLKEFEETPVLERVFNVMRKNLKDPSYVQRNKLVAKKLGLRKMTLADTWNYEKKVYGAERAISDHLSTGHFQLMETIQNFRVVFKNEMLRFHRMMSWETERKVSFDTVFPKATSRNFLVPGMVFLPKERPDFARRIRTPRLLAVTREQTNALREFNALRLLSKLPEPFRVTMLGASKEKFVSGLKQSVFRGFLNQVDRVDFCRGLSEEKYHQVLNDSFFYLRFEGYGKMPMSCIESISHYVPALVSYQACLEKEILEDGVSALLGDSMDLTEDSVTKFAESIINLYRSPSKYEEMCWAARKASEHFDIMKGAPRLIEICLGEG